MYESQPKLFWYRMGVWPICSEYAGSKYISKLMLIPSPAVLADRTIHHLSAHTLTLQTVSLISWSKVLRMSLGVWYAVLHLDNYKLACYLCYPPTLGSMVQSDTSLQIILSLGVQIPLNWVFCLEGKKMTEVMLPQSATQKAMENYDVFLTLKINASSLSGLWANKIAW